MVYQLNETEADGRYGLHFVEDGLRGRSSRLYAMDLEIPETSDGSIVCRHLVAREE